MDLQKTVQAIQCLLGLNYYIYGPETLECKVSDNLISIGLNSNIQNYLQSFFWNPDTLSKRN